MSVSNHTYFLFYTDSIETEILKERRFRKHEILKIVKAFAVLNLLEGKEKEFQNIIAKNYIFLHDNYVILKKTNY